MLRSIVARSQPLLSHLRRRAAAPGGAILPSRAYATSARPAARCEESDDEMVADPHLYMVLRENALSRFSIYKLPGLDEDPITSHDDDDEPQRLLPPAATHVGFTLVGRDPHFEAVGSKIVVTGEADTISPERNFCQFITLLYDTKTGTLDGGRALSTNWMDDLWIKPGYHAAAPVGDKLCVLEAAGNKPFYLYEEPEEVTLYLDEWVWQQGLSPLPLEATGRNINVESHAVHPDGRTIFASSSFTFSLDTESGESVRCGDWRLPFHGRAYYDNDLDAWVGIRVADGTEGGTIKGCPYLCACEVPTALADGTTLPEPAWKLCKEELRFIKTPTRGRSPTLVHTGRGNFYLVEVSEGPTARVTRLCVNYAKNAELEVTSYIPARSFLMPNYSGGLLTAFWM